MWITDAAQTRENVLRLDRRAGWKATGVSPFGVGFRGQIAPAHSDEFWLYDALGPRIWIHRDNERAPERPLVFVLEATAQQLQRRRLGAQVPGGVAHRCRGELREVRVRGPSAPPVPAFAGPPIAYVHGPHLLELVVDHEGAVRPIDDALVIRS